MGMMKACEKNSEPMIIHGRLFKVFVANSDCLYVRYHGSNLDVITRAR